jgi:hypothetical protein
MINEMYKDEMFIEKNVLRQGDIIENTFLLGALDMNLIDFLSNENHEVEAWKYKSKPKYGYAIVLSHSCEIDPANSVKLTSIILAPLRDIDKATSKSKIDDLIKSNLLQPSNTYSYLKYFYLEPHSRIEYKNGSIIDFSKTYSLRNKCYNNILEHKIIQLEETT